MRIPTIQNKSRTRGPRQTKFLRPGNASPAGKRGFSNTLILPAQAHDGAPVTPGNQRKL
jgi:hypothetical protein